MKHHTHRQKKKAPSLWSGLGGRLMFCGILVLLAALLAAGDGLLRERAAQAAAQEALEQLHQQSLVQESTGSTPAAAEPEPGSQPLAASGASSVPPDAPLAAQGQGDAPAPEFYGILRLPALGLELPVAQDCTPDRLNCCPCRFSGETDSTLVLAGHDFRRHFGGLRRLVPGDEVTFVDQAGQEHRYHMALSEVLPPDGEALLAQGDWPLTLLTCTRGGTGRLAVRFVKG